MNLIVQALQVLVAFVFLGAGGSKLAGAPHQVARFDAWRLPQWLRPVVGSAEALGALGLLVGLAVPEVAPLAAIGLCGLMVGALLTHARIHDTLRHAAPAATLLALATIIAVFA